MTLSQVNYIEMVDIYTKEQKYDIISATKRVII